MHSTISVLDFVQILVAGDAIFHSVLKLIFLAASTLAQFMQKALLEDNSADNNGAPHFLHLSGIIINTSFMIINDIASYKGGTKCHGLANQTGQSGLLFNGLESRCSHSYASDRSKGSLGFGRNMRRLRWLFKKRVLNLGELP